MASLHEKNLLDEITYLSRLIGQHKNGDIPSSRKWESLPHKLNSHLSHKMVSHPYFSAARTTMAMPYKSVNPFTKHNNVIQAHKHQEKKNDSVYINPKFKSESFAKQQRSLVIGGSTSSLPLKQSNVHINPRFSSNQSTTSAKVHMNGNPSGECGKLEVSGKVNKKVIEASSPGEKLKVHLNPKFCQLMSDNSPHMQLRTLMTNKVHVNPKLVEKVLKEKTETENKFVQTPKSSLNDVMEFTKAESCKMSIAHKGNYVSNSTCIKSASYKLKAEGNLVQSSWQGSEFVALGKRKLVRVDQKLKLESEAKLKARGKSPRSSFSLIRNRSQIIRSPSLAVKKARVISSKYKLVKNHAANQPTPKSSTNKYKIDRRSPATKRSHQTYLKSGEKYRQSLVLRSKKSSPMRSYTLKQGTQASTSAWSSSGNMVWKRTWSLQAKEFKTTNTKLYRIGNSPVLRKENGASRTKSTFNQSLVRIGGVLYKSSRNKLTISRGRSAANVGKLNSGVSLKKKGKTVTKGQVLCIRGQKFVMDSKGKTLRRLMSTDSLVAVNQNVPSVYSFRRVDIGGVTFVKKSPNLLLRTDTHKARSLLSHAKQRSIATLMRKLKKNNLPCIIYQKFGRCFRMEKGTCPGVHDRKHVAVCKRFLQGRCYMDKCLLSHDVVPEKMPTCKYFLEGCCNRQNCPYLHVKVNSKADICISFLQGYCANGKKCKKRHICLCPEFEKTGKCVKGKHCPYPHKTVRSKKSVPPKRIVMIKNSKSSPGNRKCSLGVKKAPVRPCAKNELARYYVASREIIGDTTKEISSHDDKVSGKELSGQCSIPCESEVSSSCSSVPVVASEDSKLSSSQRIPGRNKIGSLPSFIPL